MESELYNHIRPKGIISKDIRPYNQLKENGIEYLEIRSIDLNPYSTIGISMEDIEFLELVSLYCALSDAPKINDVESLCIKENIRRSSESGQNCNFITSLDGEKAEAPADTVTNSFLSELKDFAKIIGLSEEKKKMFEEFFQRNITTLSMKFIEDVEKSGGVLPLVLEKSAHTKKDINDKNLCLFKKEKELSEKEYLKEKNEDKILFEDYLEAFKGEIK